MLLVPVSAFPHRVASLLFAGALATAVVAQCSNPTIPLAANVGVDGQISAATWWDPDGIGPANPVVVFGGNFTVAGLIAATDVATFDPVAGTWGALPGLPTDTSAVASLCVLPNGDLVAGGSLGSLGGVPTRHLMRWTGSTWVTLAGGVDAPIAAMVVDATGGLVVGGFFTEAGGLPAARVARLQGTNWSALGAGLVGWIYALTVAANGDVIAGGESLVLGVPGNHFDVARWNGTSWSAVGFGISGSVRALLEDPAGLIVAGDFPSASGAANSRFLALWDGTMWSSLGIPAAWSNQLGSLTTLLRAANGDLVVGGASSSYVATVLRFDGLAWTNPSAPKVGYGFGFVDAMLEMPNGDLLVGGLLSGDDAVPIEGVVRVTPASGSAPLHNGLPIAGTEGFEAANGDLYIGGAEQPGYSTVWRRQAGSWAPLGNGPTTTILDLVELPNGDVVAAAAAQTMPTLPGALPSLSRWDGAVWSSLGALDGPVRALLVEPNGDLVAGGSFTTIGGVAANGLARWNGATWSAVATAPGPVQALLRLPSGEFVVATNNRVYRQTVAGWLPLGWNMLDVRSLALLADGTLVAGGGFLDAGGTLARNVARWNGTVWLPLGNGLSSTVTSLLPLPNGDLLAGGFFTSAFVGPALGLARWNGATWTQFGPGTREVQDLAFARNGDVLVAGSFTMAGTAPSKSVVRITTTCPATAVPTGSGCVGSGGTNTLAAQSLPWLGSTFRSTANGLAASSLAVHVLGASPASVPLPAVLPQASTGCVLQASPDALAVVPTNAGTAAITLPVPNLPGLLGLVLHQQVVALELDPFANVVGATAGNVLVLTLGAF